jgi:hypothetical protein
MANLPRFKNIPEPPIKGYVNSRNQNCCIIALGYLIDAYELEIIVFEDLKVDSIDVHRDIELTIKITTLKVVINDLKRIVIQKNQ